MVEIITWSIFFGFGVFLFVTAILDRTSIPGFASIAVAIIPGVITAIFFYNFGKHNYEHKQLSKIKKATINNNTMLICKNFIIKKPTIDRDNLLIISKNQNLVFKPAECKIINSQKEK